MLGQWLVDYVKFKGFNLPGLYFTLLKFKKIYKKRVVWLDQLDHSHRKVDCAVHPCVSYSPAIDSSVDAVKAYSVEVETSFYHFSNVLFNIRSSGFLLLDSDTLILERLPEVSLNYCDYSAGFIRMHSESYALIRLNRKKIKLNRVLFLGGNGCFNYYHWIIELAPKILYLNEQLLEGYPVDCIVCDSAIENIASFRKILEALLAVAKIDLPVVFVDKYDEVYADEVLYISNMNNVVFNTVDKLSSVQYSHFSPSLLAETRNILIQSVKPEKAAYSRIFLARKETQARLYNQDEVLGYFMTQGFQPVYLEEYSFDEQIALFGAAEFIVGPSGAAWSNLIFCQKGCKGISWLPEKLSEFSVFSSLAKIFECDLRFVMTDQMADEQDIHSDYKVNVTDLQKLYEKMRD